MQCRPLNPAPRLDETPIFRKVFFSTPPRPFHSQPGCPQPDREPARLPPSKESHAWFSLYTYIHMYKHLALYRAPIYIYISIRRNVLPSNSSLCKCSAQDLAKLLGSLWFTLAPLLFSLGVPWHPYGCPPVSFGFFWCPFGFSLAVISLGFLWFPWALWCPLSHCCVLPFPLPLWLCKSVRHPCLKSDLSHTNCIHRVNGPRRHGKQGRVGCTRFAL